MRKKYRKQDVNKSFVSPSLRCCWEWFTSLTIARCGEMIIESNGIIMASLTGSLTLSRSCWLLPELHLWASPPLVIYTRNTTTRHAGARIPCTLHRLRIALCWVDRIALRSYRFSVLKGSTSHIWTTCTFSSVTLMGTSTLSRENACDERIISATEHVSGHYSHTVWWHS